MTACELAEQKELIQREQRRAKEEKSRHRYELAGIWFMIGYALMTLGFYLGS